jgi:hypothetical protein
MYQKANVISKSKSRSLVSGTDNICDGQQERKNYGEKLFGSLDPSMSTFADTARACQYKLILGQIAQGPVSQRAA